MECPYCKSTMANVTIQSTTQVYFLKTPPPLDNPRLVYGRVRLTAKHRRSLPVCFCNDCNKVIFELHEV